MLHIKENNFANAMKNMVDSVVNKYEFYTAPRGKQIKEILNACVEIKNPYENIFNNKIRGVPRKYLAKELILYFSGRNDIEGFRDASTFWDKIKNEDGTVNSAYGNLIFHKRNAVWDNVSITQWDWAVNSLLNDKDSRQAIMHYNTPDHQNNKFKDFVCTVSNQFFIRDNKLYLTTYMRSNSILYGTTFDLVYFMLLMQCMRNSLLPYYPKLELGTYTHISASLHAYEEDFEELNEMLQNDFISDRLPEIQENPILHPALINMESDAEFDLQDPFLNWLENNRK